MSKSSSIRPFEAAKWSQLVLKCLKLELGENTHTHLAPGTKKESVIANFLLCAH